LKTTPPLTAQEPWQQQLANAFKSIDALCHYLTINPATLTALDRNNTFPFKVPKSFADCMEPGNPDDPLLRQVLPLQQENQITTGYLADPVGDLAATTESGVIHKYHGRALFITAAACAIHCRYCFRRNFPYSDHQLTPQRQQQALDYINQHPDIHEVILSGGDPLLLSDTKLARLLSLLEEIPHIKRIRLHSRLPVVLPARITGSLVELLSTLRPKTILVIHSNHANELSDEVAHACQKLQTQAITLFNQSVLLKGINDNAEALCNLSERLFELGVLPYYLHQLDKAQGTAHFAVDDPSALALHHQLQSRLPGYLVPKLVRELAGAAFKIPL
jgi:EF-P beta-lysylation protein EpmB